MAAHELSVIMVGLRGFESIRVSLQALAAQTIADRIEIVAVVPAGNAIPAPEGFASVRTVALPDPATTGRSIAAGIHEATGPVVAYVEEHSWPRGDWAEMLLRAHRSGVGAVSWSLENANPQSATSWAALLADFGGAVHPAASPSVWPPPWHHTSYRRDLLDGYGSELRDVLEAEWRLHADLRERGVRFDHAGAARSRHWNISRYSSLLQSEFRGGRSFGASRIARERWGRPRRVALAAAAPLIWLLRMRNSMSDLRRVAPPRRARVAPLLGAALLPAALGEACGYLAGPGSSRRHRAEVELDRRLSLGRSDRSRWDRATVAAEAVG